MLNATSRVARREPIAEALWRVVDREGVAGLSVAAIAAEACVPTSMVGHYLEDEVELLLMAINESVERCSARIRLQDFDSGGLDPFVRAIVELIPTTPERCRQTSIWIEVIARSEANAEVRRYLAEWDTSVRSAILELLTMMQVQKLISSELDLLIEAHLLHSVVDGASLHVMSEPGGDWDQKVREMVATYLRGLR